MTTKPRKHRKHHKLTREQRDSYELALEMEALHEGSRPKPRHQPPKPTPRKRHGFMFVSFEDGDPSGKNTLPHFVPAAVLPQLLQDLQTRYASKVKRQKRTEFGSFDMPGMVPVHREWSLNALDDHRFTLAIPLMDVSEFLTLLRKLQPRTFADGTEYYKLHGFMRCIVLLPQHKQELEKALVGIEPTAARRGLHDLLRMEKTVAAAEATGHLAAPGFRAKLDKAKPEN
jgi:hypothetical protein